jgi:hypothetical protein
VSATTVAHVRARGRLSIGAVALVALLAACDSNNDPALETAPDESLSIPDDTGAPPPIVTDDLDAVPIPRACALASTDEVAAAVGALPTASTELDRGGTLVCSFTDDDGNEMASIAIVTAAADPSPTAVFARLSEPANVEHVTGFGDDAVWTDDALHVLAADELVVFSLPPQATLEGSEAIRSATLALAEVAMPRFTAV